MLPDALFGVIHMYGLMIAIGILLAFTVIDIYCKKKSVDTRLSDFVFFNGIVSIMGGFGSAALFQAVYDYIENPAAGFKFNGGITFIGGLIGGAAIFMLGYLIFRKKFELRLTKVLSIIPCAITIAHGFGRIGCFFAGCCYGKETDFFLAVQFPKLPAPVHPTQLYEAAFLFVFFGVSSYLLLKKNFKHNMSLYLICYGVFRFFNELLRGDHRGELLGILSPSQFWSVFMVVGGIVLWIVLEAYYKKQEAKEMVVSGSTLGISLDNTEATEEDDEQIPSTESEDGAESQNTEPEGG